MRTTVSIKGLQVYGYHGLHEEERSLGQRFLFDLHCQVATVQSHADDRLEQSIGYDVLANEVSAISAARKFNTLEALAETIARILLTRYPTLETIDVHVSKYSPPMAHAVDSATVAVSLGRNEI